MPLSLIEYVPYGLNESILQCVDFVKLLGAGMIILGKSNLSVSVMCHTYVDLVRSQRVQELLGLKNIPPCAAGWSAAGGQVGLHLRLLPNSTKAAQTLSPYVRGGVLPNATFLGHSVSRKLPTDTKSVLSDYSEVTDTSRVIVRKCSRSRGRICTSQRRFRDRWFLGSACHTSKPLRSETQCWHSA
jgi:hypothetical protein